jgi:hypothetical protein
MLRTRSVVPLLLLVVLPLALCDPGFSQQGVPPGYQLLTDPQVSGGLLIAQRQGVTAATPLLIRGFTEVATFFDGRPRPTGGVRDAHDQQAEVGFQATIQRAPVTGVVIATVRRGIGTIGFVFDSPQTLARTLPRLLQLGGSPAGSPQGSCSPPPVNWQVVRYPDGSGQIQLPEGWRITGAHKGMVSASGPHGEIAHGIWTQIMTRAGAASIYASGLAPGTLPIPVADPTDPVVVLQVKWAHVAAQMRQQGHPVTRITRIIEAAPRPVPQGLSSVTMIDFEYEYNGLMYRNISQLILGTLAMDGSYLYYESSEASRSECFGQNLPTLIRISDSAQTAGHVVRERLENAMNSLRQAGEIYRQTIQNRNRAQDRMHADWTEAFRGTRIVEDTRTGRWHDADLAYSGDTVRRLNEREGYDRYREIPLRDLNR